MEMAQQIAFVISLGSLSLRPRKNMEKGGNPYCALSSDLHTSTVAPESTQNEPTKLEKCKHRFNRKFERIVSMGN